MWYRMSSFHDSGHQLIWSSSLDLELLCCCCAFRRTYKILSAWLFVSSVLIYEKKKTQKLKDSKTLMELMNLLASKPSRIASRYHCVAECLGTSRSWAGCWSIQSVSITPGISTHPPLSVDCRSEYILAFMYNNSILTVLAVEQV